MLTTREMNRVQARPGESLEVLLPEADIQARVRALGEQISQDYEGKPLLLVGILRGSFVFLGDLIRCVDGLMAVDFMAISSYGASTQSSGVVRILKDLDEELQNRHVVVVEDIVDTGLTLNYIYSQLVARGAASVAICTLLDKPTRRRVDVQIDYLGFQIPDEFVVGYGLDFDEYYRNLPNVCRLKIHRPSKEANG